MVNMLTTSAFEGVTSDVKFLYVDCKHVWTEIISAFFVWSTGC